ncbi:exodeoxyribonuclease VII small subunit [Gleimia hominis]|uniref:Exodeoxyribonuclease 7 small subunit n=1 Tax=Gleimia hominis TaxID=595468 RepID=A0ABU3IBT8_9ACTO|nr:exodeoxyribonuclease VII small subunit [Gleimia hominis]MDT3767839.1 exodeoxyribonuclease VII small subunit [Gleimia hominis]
MTDNNQAPEVEQLSYEAARDELVSIVRKLEGGQAPLEQTLALWERGEALARHCESILDSAQARMEAATKADTTQQTADPEPAQQ